MVIGLGRWVENNHQIYPKIWNITKCILQTSLQLVIGMLIVDTQEPSFLFDIHPFNKYHFWIFKPLCRNTERHADKTKILPFWIRDREWSFNKRHLYSVTIIYGKVFGSDQISQIRSGKSITCKINKQCWEHCWLKVNNSAWHDVTSQGDSGAMRSPFHCRASLYWSKPSLLSVIMSFKYWQNKELSYFLN